MPTTEAGRALLFGAFSPDWTIETGRSGAGGVVTTTGRTVSSVVEQIEAEAAVKAAAALRARLAEAIDAPSCDHDWLGDDPTEWPCVCGHHNARPYRDDVRHWKGQHGRVMCVIRAAIIEVQP